MMESAIANNRFESEVVDTYENTPQGRTLDHIIPLVHSLVCGLHIPRYMQYLTGIETSMKNNKFDGTYENEYWRNDL